MQHLLNRVRLDERALVAALRGYVVHHLGIDDVLPVMDETGEKKGNRAVGAARRYSGTAGRIENCQIAVCLAYAFAAVCRLAELEWNPVSEWSVALP